MGAELFHEHGQTDMTKLPVAFRNFRNVPKNVPGSISTAGYNIKCKYVLDNTAVSRSAAVVAVSASMTATVLSFTVNDWMLGKINKILYH